MKRSRATAYCEATPGCIMQATHKGDCLVRDEIESGREEAR